MSSTLSSATRIAASLDRESLLRENQRLRGDLRRIEAALEELREENRKSEKQNAEMVGMLAHDLRGPLSGIMGLAEMLSEENALPPEQGHEFGGLIASQAKNLIQMTSDFLELVRNSRSVIQLKLETLDPGPLFTEAARLYCQIAQRKKINFTITVPESARPEVIVDPERMRTVFANLFDNAVKYCSEGQKIEARLEVAPDQVTFVVSDTGQGLPKEELGKLFKRFGRASSRPTAGEPSSGLGLAIVREIVEEHGGKISVDGDKGKGLTFRITMPVHGSACEFPWAQEAAK